MSEETIINIDVHSALKNLENYSSDRQNIRTKIRSYIFIQIAFERNETFDEEILRRLLAVCTHDIATLKFTRFALRIILYINAKRKEIRSDPALYLESSALAYIRITSKAALPSNSIDQEYVLIMCRCVLQFPKQALIAVAENHHEELFEIFNNSCQRKLAPLTRFQICKLLLKLLLILPPQRKKVFVGKGISVWFSRIIPIVVSFVASSELYEHVTLAILELLTDDLIHIDYADNAQWPNVLRGICDEKLYPTVMKKLLYKRRNAWYRLWIAFIKLLKYPFTQPLSKLGIPINSMLLVVEAAFYLDPPTICTAFECCNVLIDSFAIELNESNIKIVLRLLMIPLISDNDKTEETALAKFQCWWHLIRRFQNKIDKFLDQVIVPLLHFSFGKHNNTDRSVIVPGQISPNVSKRCNQAIVDILGHVNCAGCTDLPKLRGKIINTAHLVHNWQHWIHSLTSVIMKTANGYNDGLTTQQLTCLWKSVLLTVGELPENNIRKDLFAEILLLVAHLVQECKSNNQILKIVYNILIKSLFNEDLKIQELFKSTNDPNDPIVSIVRIVLMPPLYDFYDSCLPRGDLTTTMKAISQLILDDRVCTSKVIISSVLEALPTHNYGLTFWNALAESICESKCDKDSLAIPNILLWPLTSTSSFTDITTPAMTWYTTYDMIYPRLHKIDIDKSISDILFSIPHTSISSVYFKLCVVLGVLKHNFSWKNCTNCKKEINLLLNLTKIMHNYENYEPIFPVMIDRIVSIMGAVTTRINKKIKKSKIAALILGCVTNVLQVLTRACRQESDVSNIMVWIGRLLKPLEKLLAVQAYLRLIPAVINQLLKCAPLVHGHPSTQSILLSVMKIVLVKTNVSDTKYDKVKKYIDKEEKILMKPDTAKVPKSTENRKQQLQRKQKERKKVLLHCTKICESNDHKLNLTMCLGSQTRKTFQAGKKSTTRE